MQKKNYERGKRVRERDENWDPFCQYRDKEVYVKMFMELRKPQTKWFLREKVEVEQTCVNCHPNGVCASYLEKISIK